MKKVLSTILAIIACFVMGIAVLPAAGCKEREYRGARKNIRVYTGIDVPDDIEVLYNYIEVGRDLTQYTCFNMSYSDNIDWLQRYSFNKEKSEDFEKDFESYLDWWGWCPVPRQYLPKYNDEYYWLTTDFSFTIYMPKRSMLIISFYTM